MKTLSLVYLIPRDQTSNYRQCHRTYTNPWNTSNFAKELLISGIKQKVRTVLQSHIEFGDELNQRARGCKLTILWIREANYKADKFDAGLTFDAEPVFRGVRDEIQSIWYF